MKNYPQKLCSPSTGFEWWTKFDPNYLNLINSTFVSGNEMSGMVGVPGKEMFTFNAISAGNTNVIMLLLRPWENGTIAERKIFPINIMSAAAAKQMPLKNESKTETPTWSIPKFEPKKSNWGSGGSITKNAPSANESVMETPTQAGPQSGLVDSELGSLKPGF
jgi:predicted secreted protein